MEAINLRKLVVIGILVIIQDYATCQELASNEDQSIVLQVGPATEQNLNNKTSSSGGTMAVEFTQLKEWQREALTEELVLAVNVSAKQFHQADFVYQVHALIQEYAINPKFSLIRDAYLQDAVCHHRSHQHKSRRHSVG